VRSGSQVPKLNVGRGAHFSSIAFVTTPFNVSPEHWARISALFDEIIDLEAPAQAAVLAKLRAESPALARELEALLHDAARSSATSQGAASPVAPFTLLLNAALAENATLHSPNERFGAWALEEKIGSGGMGEVWRAKRSDGLFEGNAAIKLLRSDLAASKLAARFARERSVLARLNHPNIARLLDAGVGGIDNDQAFLVLELVDGLPLVDYAAAHAPRVADRVRLVRDVARAVDYAHSQLVLHRDIKPSNVLVTSNGDVKLLDFGIAAAIDEAATAETAPNLTQLTGRGLTLEYAAPEQIIGEPTVAASDTYSLGAMLFHLLTGSHPFAQSKNRLALQHAAVNDEAQRASIAARDSTKNANRVETKDRVTLPVDAARIDADLDAIVAKSLRKSPAERYATAAALVNDLDAWLTRTPISIRAEDRRYRSTLWLKRNWKLAALGAVTATAVIAGLSVSLWQRSEAIASAAVAKDEAARANKVADYLGELILSASPDNHGGKWPTVLALLEQSEKDLEAKFKDDPRTHAKLLKQMLDTNDALNRDTVALAQSRQLETLLAAMQPPDVELQVDNLRQQGWLLRRLLRYDEALALDTQTLPKIGAYYGRNSAEYAKVILGQGGNLMGLGRFEEASAKLDEGHALLARLQPNNLALRLDAANDKAVLLTQQNRWREAADALAALEDTFAAVAAIGGAQQRDALISRNNLEAIRLRLGRYEGAEDRLQSIADAGNRLLGPNNMISLKSSELLIRSACETAAFLQCLRRMQERAESVKKRVGVEPSEVVEAELEAISTALLLQQAPLAASRDTLYRLIDAIETALPKASVRRSVLYRSATDAALRADDLALANSAIAKARADLIEVKVNELERAAQVDRAAAAIAFRSGDTMRAVSLLETQFRAYEKVREFDRPSYAILWLQRALFEIEFDPSAAAKSIAESRSAFVRAGGIMPQFKALTAYVDARISGNATSIREAEDAVDRAYLRTTARATGTAWRAPHLTSQ
jgi:eukaryotic-like serine/threonine-protein kinase